MIAHLRKFTLTGIVMMCLTLSTILIVPAGADAIDLISPLPLNTTPIITTPTITTPTIYTPIFRPIVTVSAPSNLTAAAVGTSIKLSWSDNSNDESGFEVERKSDGAGFSKIATVAAGTTSYTNSGLSANVQYTYRVRAVNSSASSPYSNEASATAYTLLIRPIQPTVISLAPAVPGKLSAAAMSVSEVDVSWTDQSTNESGFKLERKDAAQGYAEIAVLPANTSTYKDKGLQENTTYSYRIRSYNNSGTSAYSSEAAVQTPKTPASTTVAANPSTPITIVNDNSINITNNTNTTNNANTEVNITGSTISNSNIASNNKTNQITDVNNQNSLGANANAATGTNIVLQVSSPIMTVNGASREIDPGQGTSPTIQDSRVFIPIRALVEAMGGTLGWNAGTQQVTISLNGTNIILAVGQNSAQVNGQTRTLDTKPFISDTGRTMLPLRFVTENLGSKVNWEPTNQSVTINYSQDGSSSSGTPAGSNVNN